MGEMEWWDRVIFPIRRVWIGIATRFGVRRTGLGKLRKEVRTCEYEDVHVMWEMLRKGESAIISGRTRRGRRRGRRTEHVWGVLEWAGRGARCNLSHSF